MFWHIFHLFSHPQKSMFQFKKSILFGVNVDPLFRLQVFQKPKISKESSKGKSVIKAKKLFCFNTFIDFFFPLSFACGHMFTS